MGWRGFYRRSSVRWGTMCSVRWHRARWGRSPPAYWGTCCTWTTDSTPPKTPPMCVRPSTGAQSKLKVIDQGQVIGQSLHSVVSSFFLMPIFKNFVVEFVHKIKCLTKKEMWRGFRFMYWCIFMKTLELYLSTVNPCPILCFTNLKLNSHSLLMYMYINALKCVLTWIYCFVNNVAEI